MAEETAAETTADREIVLTRVLDASRERVFEAFTDPQQVTRWWGPTGFSITLEKMDDRCGPGFEGVGLTRVA